MNKLIVIFAVMLPGPSLFLARRAVDELPKRIDGGGHLLRMKVDGEGSPTVVMEIGLGGPLEEWAAVQPEVAIFTRTVAYDRIGSNHRQESLTGKEIAVELHEALANAHLPPPYVLVGQSFGGVYNRVFASLYPDEVVGLVLLDPTQEKFIEWMKVHHQEKEFSIMHHKGWPEAVGITPTLDELKSIGPLPNVPVVVVSAVRRNPDRFLPGMLEAWTCSVENQQSPEDHEVEGQDAEDDFAGLGPVAARSQRCVQHSLEHAVDRFGLPALTVLLFGETLLHPVSPVSAQGLGGGAAARGRNDGPHAALFGANW